MSSLPSFPKRFENVTNAVSKYGDRVLALGKYLTVADPLADDAAAALVSLGERGFATFERAASLGVARVPEAPPAFRRFFEAVEEVPAWADFDAIDRGGSLLFRTHMLGGLVLAFRSIMLGYVSPGGNKPLVYSARLQQDTIRRLIETSKFVQTTCLPGTLHRFGEGYQITLKVRLMHAKVRRMLLGSPAWNRDAWGVPINQHDMAATALLFSLEVVDGVRSLGFLLTNNEIEAYFQLWKYSSYLMGVFPDLLVGSEPDAWRLRNVIEATEGEPDDDARALANSLVHAGVRGARNLEERKRAERMLPFNRALSHHLIGEKIATQLGIKNSRVRHAIPLLTRSVQQAERARTRLPGATEWAVERGRAYWRQIVEMGLLGAPATFAPPEALARIVS
jgi:hypothetical protein